MFALNPQVKMNRMRQRIAQRLKDSQNTYAMLTTFNDVDMRYEQLYPSHLTFDTLVLSYLIFLFVFLCFPSLTNIIIIILFKSTARFVQSLPESVFIL